MTQTDRSPVRLVDPSTMKHKHAREKGASACLWTTVCLIGISFSGISQENASTTAAPAVVDGAPAVEPVPAEPDEPQPTIDDLLKEVLKSSDLPSRRRNRLLAMAGGAYANHSYKPLWTKKDPAIVLERLSDTLKSHALDPFAIPDFAPSGKEEWPEVGISQDDARLTLQVAEAGLLLKEGPATEKLIWEHWNQGDTPGTIDSITHTANITKVFADGTKLYRNTPERILQEFVPKNWIYKRLRSAWIGSIANPSGAALAYEGVIYSGRKYSGSKELARILNHQGYLSDADGLAVGDSMTKALSTALREYQRGHGLYADGKLGPKTLKVLNRDPNRDRQIIVLNMHRARLIPNELGNRYVIANLPSGEIYGFDKDEPTLQMRIVFGSNTETRRTPIFRDKMEEVIFRPYWWVPNSIAKEEYLPKAWNNYSYLSRRGYQIVKGGFDNATVMKVSKYSLGKVQKGEYILRQKSGYGNALGLVKFRFPQFAQCLFSRHTAEASLQVFESSPQSRLHAAS